MLKYGQAFILAMSLNLLPAYVAAVEPSPTLQDITARAEQGQSQAQYELAMRYQRGLNAPKDEAQALHWLEKAASQQHIDAQLQLGMMYFSGQGVSKNNAKAAEWFRLAAQQQASQRGIDYRTKGIVPENINDRVVWWLERSAEWGQGTAAYVLAQIHQQANKLVDAMKWGLIAQRQGQAEADGFLENIRQHNNAQQQAQAEEWAEEWQQRHPTSRQ